MMISIQTYVLYVAPLVVLAGALVAFGIFKLTLGRATGAPGRRRDADEITRSSRP